MPEQASEHRVNPHKSPFRVGITQVRCNLFSIVLCFRSFLTCVKFVLLDFLELSFIQMDLGYYIICLQSPDFAAQYKTILIWIFFGNVDLYN